MKKKTKQAKLRIHIVSFGKKEDCYNPHEDYNFTAVFANPLGIWWVGTVLAIMQFVPISPLVFYLTPSKRLQKRKIHVITALCTQVREVAWLPK